MRKRLPLLIPVIVLCLGFLAVSASAVSKWEKRQADRIAEARADNITIYSLPAQDRKPVHDFTDKDMDESAVASTRGSRTVSLGVASAASPGLTIRTTQEDWQYSVKGRYIDWAPAVPSIQFAYVDLLTATAADRGFGYNVYDPVAGQWPRGLGVGCRIQPTDTEGRWLTSVVLPDGRIVLAGEDAASDPIDHHIYANISLHGCFWGGGSIIPHDQYKTTFVDTTRQMRHAVVDMQVVGTDTVIHVVAHENGFDADAHGSQATVVTINYFRKIGGSMTSATWTGPTAIDSGFYRGTIAASRVSDKVCIAYTHPSAWAVVNSPPNRDNDVYYCESSDAGLTWAPVTNLTNYDRTVFSRNPWVEVQPFYDSQGDLHILFEGNPIPAGVYDSATFFWGDFTTSLIHWSSKTQAFSRVANRDYGLVYNTQVCGMGGANTHYLAFYDIAECNGRLYVTYAGWQDLYGTGTIDDCASSFGDAPSRIYQANGELYMHVSSSLDGLLWDAPRNLTNTYTPGCDSAAGGGECMNDTKTRMARVGMDSAAYGQELVFPTTELVVVDETYSGSHYINLFYLTDHFPGNAAINRGTIFTENPLNWMRIGCIDPVTAPQIAYAPTGISYPQYINHGDSLVVTITVTNDGNTTLHCGIDTAKTSPASDWLAITEDTLVVPAGVDNTRSFDVILNPGGNINAEGTVVALNGEVYILSDADAPRDSVSYLITDFLIADTVGNLYFDTVATLQTMLVLDNHGTSGNGGIGGVNLDYTAIGGDCDPNATWYLFDGGPFVIQNQGGGEYTISAGMHNSGGFLGETVWYPTADPTGLVYAEPAHLTGSNYDGFFSGTIVNQDTTIAVEVTTWAPTGGGDSSNFMIQRYDFFSADGNPHNNLAFGATEDWDIPSDVG
ncbi:MAG: hypothetical protein JSU65_01350, partial [Candidatus Zixiibacteriota bacterium]